MASGLGWRILRPAARLSLPHSTPVRRHSVELPAIKRALVFRKLSVKER
jgi:hypothetical protein